MNDLLFMYIYLYLLSQILLKNRPEIKNICNFGGLFTWCMERANLGLSRGKGDLGNVTEVMNVWGDERPRWLMSDFR